MQEPFVSVIMPAFNAQKTIGEAIASVIKQTYKNLEIVIVDDGSTDKTLELIKVHAQTYNNIRFFVHDKNKGAAIARQKAIQEAKGSYLAFLDCQDTWKPDKLAVQIATMEATSVFFSCTHFERIDGRGNPVLSRMESKDMLTYNDILKGSPENSTIVFNRTYYSNLALPDIHKGLMLWYHLGKYYDLYCIPKSLGYLRVEPGTSWKKNLKSLHHQYRIYTKYENLHPLYAGYTLCLWATYHSRLYIKEVSRKWFNRLVNKVSELIMKK